MNRVLRNVTPGIPDDLFIRQPGVPMTKCEIRVLTLAKLGLFAGATVYDVGAGSGTIAIECKRLAPRARVFAVEKNPAAVKTMVENCRRFGVSIEIIEGVAPEALVELPPADRIFIGGNGGNLTGILCLCHDKLKNKGRIVVNSVTLDTGARTYKYFESLGYRVEATQANIAVLVKRGNTEMWQSRNPVTIIAAEKGGS